MKTWIFQGNPGVFDIDSYLASTAGLITWRVARYAEEIEPGDTVYIWRSQGDQPSMAGIVAEGTVVEPPRVQPDDPISAEFWKEAPGQDELMRVRVRLNRIAGKRETLKREWMKQDSALAGLLILRQAAGTNFPVAAQAAQRLGQLWRKTGTDWERDEVIAALNLYEQLLDTPNSKVAGSEVERLAQLIGRAPKDVYNKLTDLRSIDPRDSRSGFQGGSKIDQATWDEFFDTTTMRIDAQSLEAENRRLWGSGVKSDRLTVEVLEAEEKRLTAPTAFEIGEGIYTAGSPGTLTRAQIRRNTAGGTSAINWGAGNKYLMLAPSAANLPTLDTAGALTAPALSLTGNAAVGGTLAVTSNATIGTGLTVTSGGASITAGGLTVTAGGLSVGAGGASIAGNSTIIGDLTTYRSGAPTTGYHYFGNTGGRYIGFDGTNCVIVGMNVYNANGSFYLSSGGGFYGNTLRDYSLGQNTGLNLNDTTIDFITNGAFAGYVDSGGNIGAAANFVVFSDRRLKQRIRRYGDGAAAVDAIQAKRFQRRDLGGEHIGFIAQEVAAQLPEAVTTTRDGMLALKEMPLIAALWQALQATRIELRRAQHRIDKLEAGR